MTKRKRLEKTVWAGLPGRNFEVKLRFLPRSELTQMVQKATELTWDQRSGQNLETINPEILRREYVGVILDWRDTGKDTLSREVYGQMINIDPEDYPEVIPCTDEYKAELLTEAYGFDIVVRQVCTDLARFQSLQIEAAAKN